MSDDHGHEIPYDPELGFHPSCVTDQNRPTFDAEWQRRAFGLAVALSEFGHYSWAQFQEKLIAAIGRWEQVPDDQRGRWAYYEHWVTALLAQVEASGLLEDDTTAPAAASERSSPPTRV